MIFQQLKERKLVQWGLAYLAGAWATLEALGFVAERFGWPEGLLQAATILVAFGFFGVLVLAWYHGEKGRQRVSGPELLMIALLLVIAGTGLSLVRGRSAPADETSPVAADPAAPVEDVAATLNALPSMAVLPFANRSGNPDDRYFTDGIHDELLTNLQRVRDLRVISRTSSDAYRDTDKTVPEIANELGVGYILEGGVQRAGDRVRINVQLIDAVNEGHLWAETYDRTLAPDSLFEIQSEIVRTVAARMGFALTWEEWIRAARRSTSDPVAYELYARGRELSGVSLGWREESAELFRQAVARDPSFLAAHASLAATVSYRYQNGWMRHEQGRAEAQAAAERALELDPESPDAQLAMGIYLYRVDKDFQGALDWFDRAAGSLRGDFWFQLFRGYAERRMGRWPQAVASLRAALALSPGYESGWRELGLTYLMMRRFAEAEAALQEALHVGDNLATVSIMAALGGARGGTLAGWHALQERSPSRYRAWWLAMKERRFQDAAALVDANDSIDTSQYDWEPRSLREGLTLEALGNVEAARERYRAAAEILEAQVASNEADERHHAALGLAYAGLGRRDDAVREARRAVEIMPVERDAMAGPFQLLRLAAVHARLGEVDEALEVVERILSVPSRLPPGILETEYLLLPILDDPRFQALIDRHRDRVF